MILQVRKYGTQVAAVLQDIITHHLVQEATPLEDTVQVDMVSEILEAVAEVQMVLQVLLNTAAKVEMV